MESIKEFIIGIVTPKYFTRQLLESRDLDVFFLVIYSVIVTSVEYLAKRQEGIILAILSISLIFLSALGYWLIIRLSGGMSTYVQALNFLLPIETIAQLSRILIGFNEIGKPFVLIVNLYCFYLQIYGVFQTKHVLKKRVCIVYVCYIIGLVLIADIIFLIISGIAISDWGYLG